MKKRVGIIGGGASGLVAAIGAARNGAEVTVIEHMDRVGKRSFLQATAGVILPITNGRRLLPLRQEGFSYAGNKGL